MSRGFGLAVVAAWVLSSCCCGNCGPKKESYVTDVPATLKQARALANPPKTTVEIERVTRPVGGGGSCHSALCLVFVPVMLYDALFPEQWDALTVKQDGAETFTGTYTTGGELIEGRLQLPGAETKQVVSLRLDALDKQVVVESARFKPCADGGLVRTATSLQAQHDFVADYRQALTAEKKPDKRGALLREALQWLALESLPLLKERLADAAEPDAAKAAVMATLCGLHANAKSELEAPLVAALGDAPGPQTAVALLACADDDARRGLLLALITAGICTEDQGEVLENLGMTLLQETGARAALRQGVLKKGAACAAADRRALLGIELKEPVEQAGLTQLLVGRYTLISVPRLEFKDPIHRAAYFEALATRSASTEALLRRIEETRPASGPELAQVARAYLLEPDFLARDRVHAELLVELHQAQLAKADTAGALKVISAARDAAPGRDRPQFEIALVALGDTSRAAEAAKGAEDPIPGRHGRPGNFIYAALVRSGCSEHELKAFLAHPRPALGCAGWNPQPSPQPVDTQPGVPLK